MSHDPLDRAVFNAISASPRGEPRANILSTVPKLTSHALTASLDRLMERGRIKKATFDGVIRYYVPGTSHMAKGNRDSTQKRLREKELAARKEVEVVQPRRFTSSKKLVLGPSFNTPARAGATDFMKHKSLGL